LTGVSIAGDFTADVNMYGVELNVRPVELGITNTITGERATVRGRSADPTTAITFEIPPSFRILDQLNTIYFIERLAVDIDSNSVSVTPSITTENATITLTAISSTARNTIEEDVERVGPVQSVTLTGDFTGDVQLFGIEMAIRPVSLGVRIGQQRFDIDGRFEDANTSLIFDIDPENKLLDSLTFIPLLERLSIDMDTNSNPVTVTILAAEATSITTGDTINVGSRFNTILFLNYVTKVRGIQLLGSFDTGAISLYGLELVVEPLNLILNVQGT
jgi:hypothetical protein